MGAAICALAIPAMAFASTDPPMWVDDGNVGGDTTNCQDQNNPCQTIGYAISQETAGATGDTINVGGGTYSESFNLGQAELLVRNAFASTAVGADTSGAVTITGSTTPGACPNPTIDVSSPATIANVEVSSSTNGCEDVAIEAVAGAATVRDSTFYDVTKASETTPDVVVYDGAGSPAITDNAFASGTDDQLALVIHGASSPTGGSARVTGNTYTGFATAIAAGVPGDLMVATPSVASNTITGTHDGGGPHGGVGIDVTADADPAITANVIKAPAPGLTTGVSIVDDNALSPGTGAIMDRNQILGLGTGVSVVDAGASPPSASVKMNSDLILNSTTTGLYMEDSGNTGLGNVAATNVDIFATATPNPEVSNKDAHLALDSSIIGSGGIGTSLGTTATCTITYSRGPATAGSGCHRFQTSAVPHFVSASDVRLTPGSTMIDAGNPAAPAASKDVYDRPRLVDGNRDCNYRRDIGATEFDPGGLRCVSGSHTSVRQHRLQEYLSLTSKRNVGNYRLCIARGSRVQCKGFRVHHRRGAYSSTVTWAKRFRYLGPGYYRATWSSGSGRQRFGHVHTFHWGTCAPSNLSMRGLWRPSRLIVLSRCHSIRGRVVHVSGSEGDGDFHVAFAPAHGGSRVHTIEIIPRDQPRHLPRPRAGQRMTVTGVYVCDTFHGPFGHTEIHPIFRIKYLTRRGRVIRTRTSGPQYPGTPTFNLKPEGRFHCPGI